MCLGDGRNDVEKGGFGATSIQASVHRSMLPMRGGFYDGGTKPELNTRRLSDERQIAPREEGGDVEGRGVAQ